MHLTGIRAIAPRHTEVAAGVSAAERAEQALSRVRASVLTKKPGAAGLDRDRSERAYPNTRGRPWALTIMKKSIGIDSMVFVREARKATRAAFALAASSTWTSPSTFF